MSQCAWFSDPKLVPEEKVPGYASLSAEPVAGRVLFFLLPAGPVAGKLLLQSLLPTEAIAREPQLQLLLPVGSDPGKLLLHLLCRQAHLQPACCVMVSFGQAALKFGASWKREDLLAGKTRHHLQLLPFWPSLRPS